MLYYALELCLEKKRKKQTIRRTYAKLVKRTTCSAGEWVPDTE